MGDMIHPPSFPPLPDRGYRTIAADPPWRYDDSLPGPGRGASSHYDTLTPDAVAALGPSIRSITAPHAHAYLWITNSFIPDGKRILEAWGFEYKTLLTWKKPQMGMGHYYRNFTEHIMFGVKGGLSTNRDDAPNVLEAPRSDHSRKPAEAYELIESQSPTPRLNLFARNDRSGWDSWGDEAPGGEADG